MTSYHLAFVTGATSGIGWELCHLLARKKIPLIISGRDSSRLQLLEKNLKHSVKVQTLQADLTRLEDCRRLVAALHEWAPDLVINSAGFGLYGDALTYSTHEQVNILEVNGRSLLELTLEAARTLISQGKKGVIFNISSAAGFRIFPGMAVYAASKAFVINLSQALDFEFKPYGVRVLTTCPGMVFTDFQKRAGGGIKSDQLGVMNASFVAEQIWQQIERLHPFSIIDWRYRLLTYLSFLFPKNWVAAVGKRMIEKRIPSRTVMKNSH